MKILLVPIPIRRTEPGRVMCKQRKARERGIPRAVCRASATPRCAADRPIRRRENYRDGNLLAVSWSLTLVALVTLGGCKTGDGQAELDRELSIPQQKGGAGQAQEPKFVAEKRIYWNQVAGQFYPGDPDELGKSVGKYLAEADPAPAAIAQRDLLGFICPHAGYTYSGPVAGWAYRLLEGRNIGTVIVLGFSHKGVGEKAAVLDFDAYRTPLGPIPIDTGMVETLLAKGQGVIESSQAPFMGEHSLEAQLPFIAKAAPGARIVPIMVGHSAVVPDAGLVSLLLGVVGSRKDVLIVASTDLSHYKPYDEAVGLDGSTLDLIAGLRWDSIAAEGQGAGRICGYSTVGTLMGVASRFGEGKVAAYKVKYLNSGDTAGGKEGGVVGYGVVAFTLDPGARAAGVPTVEGSVHSTDVGPFASSGSPVPGGLSADDRASLLTIARNAAMAAARGETWVPEEPVSLALRKTTGAFVTVRVEGRFRGSGGASEATLPLYKAVAAAASAAIDSFPGFATPTEKEMAGVQCEVVVVRSVVPLAAMDQHDPVARGIIIVVGNQTSFIGPGEGPSGGWDRDECFSHACRRAGLTPECWKLKKQEMVPSFSAFEGERFADWDGNP